MNDEQRQSNLFFAPVSVGEVVDKITILRIKTRTIKEEVKLENITKELVVLEASLEHHVGALSSEVTALMNRLQTTNQSLWDIEDRIRDCERRSDFGPEFIRLARAVYLTNDQRAALKRQINLALGSALVEEKSYRDYRADVAS